MMISSFIADLDKDCTDWIRRNVGSNRNAWISQAPYYCGLLPYELYVLPGMFVALFGMLFYESPLPLQFHLLPHWFAFSMTTYIKQNVKRIRPGCAAGAGGAGGGIRNLIDPHHCQGSTRMRSFPSGHACIAAALATSLSLFLRDPSFGNSDKTVTPFPGIISITAGRGSTVQAVIIFLAFFVAVMISIHRVSYGYHNVSDVLAGALLGFAIAFTTDFVCRKMRTACCGGAAAAAGKSMTTSSFEKMGWDAIRWSGMGLASVAIGHFFAFKLQKLSTLQH